MWHSLTSSLKPYREPLVLLSSLLCGALLGIFLPQVALSLKSLGQIFLNLLFMIIVPLVAVSVTSSIARMTDLKRLGRLLLIIMGVSVSMALMAALLILGLAQLFDPAQGVTLELGQTPETNGTMDLVGLLTVNDFPALLSKSNILALIIMSVIAGIAIGQSGEDGRKILTLRDSLNTVIMKIVAIIMWAAPLGLGAYFAATMASQDPALLLTFGRAIGLFAVSALLYLTLGSSCYAWLGDGREGIRQFWRNMPQAAITALATSSSLATLPVNLRCALKMGIREEIADISLPLLVNINKGGAAMITALKIVFIYSLLGLDFGADQLLLTLAISVLSAFVIGGVPGGAFLGEVFIVTTLGLPTETIPILVILGAVTDGVSTVINVVHDLNASQIIERLVGRRPEVDD
jgi:Na+/H+-dicarboxylate symporter